jgi:hypothetical protein
MDVENNDFSAESVSVSNQSPGLRSQRSKKAKRGLSSATQQKEVLPARTINEAQEDEIIKILEA